MNDSIINLSQIVKALNLSRSSVRRLELRGEFPQRIKLGRRRIGWLRKDIIEWLSNRQKESLK